MSVAERPRIAGKVRRQYERVPYPRRDPFDEDRRLCAPALDDLAAVNFYCFRGRRNLQEGFRALVAGGGTGDALIYLAHQLRDCDAEIVYLDVSRRAMDIARARARRRGLEGRITWREGSLLDLPEMEPAPFDYINCTGVLHHLDDPDAGLDALQAVLKEDGALGLVVNAPYGRTGLYQVQRLMRLLDADESDTRTAVDNVRGVLDALPPTNWFVRGGGLALLTADPSDAELYDMFLGGEEHVYSVPELYDLLDRHGLSLAEFTIDRRVFYQPGFAARSPQLERLVSSLPLRQQQAAAEMFYGTIGRHTFWACPSEQTQADPSDPENVPFFTRLANINQVRDTILETNEGERWSFKVTHPHGVHSAVGFPVVPAARRFVELIDGQRTMGEIVETIAADYDPRPSEAEVWQACRTVIDNLLKYDLLLFRHVSVPPICTD